MDLRGILLNHHFLGGFRGKAAPAVQIAAVRPCGGRLRRPCSAAVEVLARAHRDRDAAPGEDQSLGYIGSVMVLEQPI